MSEELLSEDDLARIRARGARRRRRAPAARGAARGASLHPPAAACTPGDGIHVLSDAAVARALETHARAAAAGRFLCFVPASGAATRMFRALLAVLEGDPAVTRAGLEERAAARRQGLPGGARLHRRPATLRVHRRAPGRRRARTAPISTRRCAPATSATDPRLRCSAPTASTTRHCPRACSRFHRYPAACARTAFEEHLVDAAPLRARRVGRGPPALHGLRAAPGRLRDAAGSACAPDYEARLGARFTVAFSHQAPATDTVAVDLDGRPFRDGDGPLLFRPGGHGALLDNLARCGADVAFVKNIDNVVPDHLKAPVVHWKKVLGGLLVGLQDEIFAALRRLEAEPGAGAVDAALALLARELDTPVPARWRAPARRRGATSRAASSTVRCASAAWCAARATRAAVRSGSAEPTARASAADRRDRADRSRRRRPAARSSTARRTSTRSTWCAACATTAAGPSICAATSTATPSSSARSRAAGASCARSSDPACGTARWRTGTRVFVEVPTATFNPVKTVNDLLRPSTSRPRPERRGRAAGASGLDGCALAGKSGRVCGWAVSSMIVTGGAGLHRRQLRAPARCARTAARVVVLDKLTYAGNLESLRDVERDPRFVFVHGDIADGALVARLLARAPADLDRQLRRRVARRPLDRRAARLRRDQHRRHLRAARGGRRHLAAADDAARARLPLPARLDRRGLRHPRRDRHLLGDHALRAELALRRVQGRRRPPGARLPRDLRPADADHQLLEQLRPVPVSRRSSSRWCC